MMDTFDAADQPPLIIFDDVDDEPKTFSSGHNENSSAGDSVSFVGERMSVCSGIEVDSSGLPGNASGGNGTAKKGEDLDASGMEDMIQKILEKYGETEEQTGGITTPGIRTTSQDDAARCEDPAAKRETADSSVSDMIKRESSKWDRVYGTEDNHTSVSTRDWTGRQEIGSRRPVTSTEGGEFNDHVEIGSVIRSQTGVAKQLISVSEGLDEVNDDLEEMKREIERIQTKAYTCLEGRDEAYTSTEGRDKAYTSIESRDQAYTDLEGRDKTYTGLEGRFKTYTGLEGRDKAYARLEGRNEAYTSIEGRDNAYTSIESRDKAYTRLEGRDVLARKTAREFAPIGGLQDEDTIYRRQNEWTEEREGVVRFDDGNSVQETGRYWRAQSTPASCLPGAGRAHIRENDVHVAHLLTIAEPTERCRQTRSLVDDGAAKRERQHLEVDRFGRPITKFVTFEEPPSKRDSSRRKPDGYCYMCEEFGDVDNEWKRKPAYDETSRTIHRSHNHTYNSLPVPDLGQKSHERSLEDLGIYKTSSGVYFYSDEARSYPNENNLHVDPVTGITRSFYRQASVPRGFQSQQNQLSAAVQRHDLSETYNSSTGFTSKFLAKVRRRNSLGSRVETDRYRAQSLKIY